MRLRDLWSQVGMLLGDPEFQQIHQNEITMDLNMAQKALARTLIDVDREQMMYWTSVAGVASQIEYDLPLAVDEIQRMSYANKECQRISVRDIGVLEVESRNTLMRGSKTFQQYYYVIQGAAGRMRVGIYPIPDDTSSIYIYYVARPVDFSPFGSHNGAATGNGSGTTLEDTGLPTETIHNDWWNNAEIVFKSGGNVGDVVRVTDFVASTATFTFQPSVAPSTAPGDTYEVDQVSIIPEQHHDMLVFYAAALAAARLGKSPAPFMEMYMHGVGDIRRRWTSDIEATAVGEQPAEIRS